MKRLAVTNFSTVRPRANRFPSSQQNVNKIENLFTRIFELLVRERYAEAEEAIFAGTELKLCQGELDAVIERVSPLARDYPTNDYYFTVAPFGCVIGS